MQSYISMWKNYFNFSGRTSRKDFWLATLFNIIIAVILSILIFFTANDEGFSPFSIVSGLYSLAIVIPSLSLYVRRLHDIDKSGFWYLINFVPVVGSIVLFIFCVMAGTEGTNRFGASPYETNIYEKETL